MPATALTNPQKQARHRARRRGIIPEWCDIERVDAQRGRQAERYRLYQARALIRFSKNG
jgi:hypothetical protein